MIDVLIVGAGPAGSVAATVLARAGLRVRIIDRATFPRDKLCGDTVNPGTLARLRHLHMATPVEAGGLAVTGMLVTGERGVAIEGRYPDGVIGRALTRSALDWLLLQQAIAAGATFEPAVAATRAILTERKSGSMIAGVDTAAGPLPARVTIGADGRRSTLAFGLGLARHPTRPRRWAIGAYFENVASMSSLGEMHVRPGHYIGVAPLPAGLTNVCLVVGSGGHGHPHPSFRDPSALLQSAIAGESALRDRFADARLVRPPVVLGPLAVDAAGTSIDGLLLAGDAAGFIDPMTGDGMRFAVRGGELAAAAAIEALTSGWSGVHARLAAVRAREFDAKRRFNRTLRSLVGSSPAMRVADLGARLVPGLIGRIVARAGDCHLTAC